MSPREDATPVGTKVKLGIHTFRLDEMLAFSRAYDPQPFHVDEEAARRSHFGALVASGWHTCAMWMKYSVAYQQAKAEAARAAGETPPGRGPGIGFKNLRWLKPVYAGDTLTFYTEVKDKRPSAGKPGWAVATMYNSAINQHGDLVLDFEIAALHQLRD